MHKTLLKKINSKNLSVGIFGLGYVGLPLALRFAEKKFEVYGYVVNVNKINKIKRGRSYISQIPNSKIKKYINKNLKVYSDFRLIDQLNVLIFCLPTPIKNKSQICLFR